MTNNIEFNLGLIIEEYSNYIYKIIDNIIGERLPLEDKEEIMSDTFYLLWKNQSKINTNLKSYLSTIARNCAYSKLRKNNIIYEYNERVETSYNMDCDDIIIIKEKLKKLTKEEKLIFEQYYILGYKVSEISKKLNKTSSYIKIKLYRLRKKLKEEF